MKYKDSKQVLLQDQVYLDGSIISIVMCSIDDGTPERIDGGNQTHGH
jgi:hypothetical protein